MWLNRELKFYDASSSIKILNTESTKGKKVALMFLIN